MFGERRCGPRGSGGERGKGATAGVLVPWCPGSLVPPNAGARLKSRASKDGRGPDKDGEARQWTAVAALRRGTCVGLVPVDRGAKWCPVANAHWRDARLLQHPAAEVEATCPRTARAALAQVPATIYLRRSAEIAGARAGHILLGSPSASCWPFSPFSRPWHR